MANHLVPYSQDEQKWDQPLYGTGNGANQTQGNDQTIERKDGAAIYCLTHNAIGGPS